MTKKFNTLTPQELQYCKTIGQVILELKAEKQWTQEDLARCAEVSRNTIGVIERGLSFPSIAVMRSIVLKGFDMKLSEFFALVDREYEIWLQKQGM